MKYIYINESSSVAIKEEGGIVESVYIDGKEKEFEPEDARDKKEYAVKTKRNKYKEILSRQFENLVVLSGAGTSKDVGKDDKLGKLLFELWAEIETKLSKVTFDTFCDLVKYTDKKDNGEYIENLEKLLSMANAAKDFVQSNEIDIGKTIKTIQKIIKDECTLELPDDSPHQTFLEKITRRKVTLPRTKLFTLNYDTLFEQAGRRGNFTIIDGFSFSSPRIFSGRNFDIDIVKRDKSRLKAEDNFINRVFHLYKPHGSVDWEQVKGETFQNSNAANPLMIYPKDSKYENSYRQPFFEMMSRFQQCLRSDNILLICIGFSFGDKHLVAAIQEALEQNAGFQLMVVNKEIDESIEWLFENAKQHQNIVLIDELFKDFAEQYPLLKSYIQDEYKKISVGEYLNNGE